MPTYTASPYPVGFEAAKEANANPAPIDTWGSLDHRDGERDADRARS
jgi:hypothetical protein